MGEKQWTNNWNNGVRYVITNEIFSLVNLWVYEFLLFCSDAFFRLGSWWVCLKRLTSLVKPARLPIPRISSRQSSPPALIGLPKLITCICISPSLGKRFSFLNFFPLVLEITTQKWWKVYTLYSWIKSSLSMF